MEDNKEKARPLTENLNYRETGDGEIELTLRIPSPMDHAEELIGWLGRIIGHLGPLAKFIDMKIDADELVEHWLDQVAALVYAPETNFAGRSWLCLSFMVHAARIAMNCQREKAIAQGNRTLEALIGDLEHALSQKVANHV